MRIIGIGDLLIPCSDLANGFKRLEGTGIETAVIDWGIKDYEELQNINLIVEQGGSEAYDPSPDMIDALKDADIIITQFFPINKKVIDACPNLKAIGILRAGFENINMDYASRKGILVFNTPGRNANAVADFTVGMLIGECRNIAKSHLELKQGNWQRDYANAASVPDLNEKTVGIVGYGNIGQKVAKRLRAFGMNILAFDPYVDPAACDVEMVSLEEMMNRADFVTIHARLTQDTWHLIDRKLLLQMKPTAYLINTARSGIVDEDALFDMLREHRIAGAALDVYELEPPGKDYKMIPLDNVTVTPHLAGGTRDAFSRSPVLLMDELRKVLVDKRMSRFLLNENDCKNNVLLQGITS